MQLDPGRRFRAAVRRAQAPRPAGARPGPRARYPAAGRAHQPPGHRRHRLAGRFPAALRRHAALRHPRPHLPAQAGHPHRRNRPRAADRLVLRLRHLCRAQSRRSWKPKRSRQAQFDKKLAQEEAWIRQGIEARRTRNEGRVRALGTPARQRRRAPRAARHAAHAGAGSRALGQAGGRGRRMSASAIGRPARRARLLHHHHARRQGRHRRAQRLGQDHAAAPAAGRAAPAGRQRAPRHQPGDRLFRPAARPARRRPHRAG